MTETTLTIIILFLSFALGYYIGYDIHRQGGFMKVMRESFRRKE